MRGNGGQTRTNADEARTDELASGVCSAPISGAEADRILGGN